MIRSNASAVRTRSQPWPVSGVEKPKPGIDGTTTWNAGPSAGSARAGASAANSTNDAGYPWHSSSGVACSWAERTCSPWTGWPSTSARNCGMRLSRCSWARQSKPVRQCSASRRA